MTNKWSKKEAIKCLVERRNPFQEDGRGLMPNLTGMAEKVKQVLNRNRGIK